MGPIGSTGRPRTSSVLVFRLYDSGSGPSLSGRQSVQSPSRGMSHLNIQHLVAARHGSRDRATQHRGVVGPSARQRHGPTSGESVNEYEYRHLILWVLKSYPTIRPSANTICRLAAWARAALWVTTIIVNPSRFNCWKSVIRFSPVTVSSCPVASAATSNLA